MNRINVHTATVNGVEVIHYEGPINEDTEAELATLQKPLGQNVSIDLREVSNVNSCGIRSWIRFLRSLGNERTIVLKRCPVNVVNTILIAPDFLGRASI